ncbi:transcriptional regulator [Actinorhabdospora filicis]|uniref:Transcriptional regulator n=1 Tax=Actinorhabdospora filicis TaxID=1785913 RepID=A0A9W6SNC3_9ACTN|nr:BlaI/MecI/CopY family transcriptional regulator [Actinorhabdospora filicis]GLZ80065.1 transcriptional regulator [Actinorhabdospora filicis]
MARLGELERAVMEVLWTAGRPVTARAVVDSLPDRSLAATTVLTVLSRLEAKGFVARDRNGRAHHYRAVAGREEHVAALMREALDTAADRGAALARFAEEVSPAEAAALADALNEAVRRREPGS